MRCATCNGIGAVPGPRRIKARQAVPGPDLPCPEPHIAIVEEGLLYDRDEPADVTVLHDPATVLLWCRTHDGQVRWLPYGSGYWCLRPDRPTTNARCDVVAFAMPTEPLGELA